MNDCGSVLTAKRDPAAHELMNTIERVAALAEKMSARVAEQLHGVCLPERPSPERDAKEAPQREYPPLLDNMRGRVASIERSLRMIGDVMDRCEM